MEITLFVAKKIRCTLDQIGLGELRRKTYYMDSAGIVGTIRQRLKDIELQYLMRERSNDMTRDADQNNKREHTENYKCDDYLR